MKKKSWKQALSMLLAVALMATLLVVPAGAATNDAKNILNFSTTIPSDSIFTVTGSASNADATKETISTVTNGDGTNLDAFTKRLKISSSTTTAFVTFTAPSDGTLLVYAGQNGTNQATKTGLTLADTTANTSETVGTNPKVDRKSVITTLTFGAGESNKIVKGNKYELKLGGTELKEHFVYYVEFIPSVATEYDINIDEAITNGQVTTSVTKAAAGTVVTVTAVPNDGYKLAENGITVSKAEGTVAVTDGKFTMPAEAVTVSATFEQDTRDDSAVVAEAKEKIAAVLVDFTVAQADVADAAAAKTAVDTAIVAAKGTCDAAVTISDFQAATAGTKNAPNGITGSFSISVAVTKDTAAEDNAPTTGTGTITPTAYVPTPQNYKLSTVIADMKSKGGYVEADPLLAGPVYNSGYFRLVADTSEEGLQFRDKSGNWLEVGSADKGNGIEFTVESTANVTARISSTGKSNWSVAALKSASGDQVIKAKTDGSATVYVFNSSDLNGGAASNATVASDAKVVLFKTANEITLTYEDLPAGTYRLYSPVVTNYGENNPTTRGFRVYELDVTESDAQRKADIEDKEITEITVDPANVSLVIGGTENLSYVVKPEDALNRKVTWASDNESVATVAVEKGKVVVTAKAIGTANITATSVKTNTITGTCAVTVKAPAQASAATFEAMTADHYGSFGWAGMPATIGDMQTNVAFAADENTATTIKASGTLKYVTGFTGFNGSDVAEQSGNYVALELNRPSSITGVTSTVKVPAKGVADAKTITLPEDDGNLSLIFRVSSTSANPVIKVDWDGEGEAYTETAYTLDFSGLKLEKPASVTPTFAANGDVSQLTSKTDKEVSFTLSNASAGDYVLYDAAGNKACSADSVKADNGVITFTLSTALDPATADSTDDVKYTVKVTDDADHGQSAAAEVTVKRYIPVDSITLTHFTADGADSEVSGTVNHVLYEKLNDGDADVTGSTENPNPSYPNAWKLAPIVKGPGDKTPTDPRVTFSNLKETPEFISVAADGTVTALKAGTGRVRVASVADPEKYVGFNMTVKVRIGSISLKHDGSPVSDGAKIMGQVGSKANLSAEVTTSAGGKNADGSLNNTYQAVKWTSSNTDVATVNETTGVVTLLNVGDTTITATSTVDPTVSVSKEVNVVQGNPKLTLTSGNAQVASGGTVRFKLEGVPTGVTPTFTVKKDNVEVDNVTVTPLEGDANYNYQAVMPANDTGAAVTYEFSAAVAESDNWTAATSAPVSVSVQDASKKNIWTQGGVEQSKETTTGTPITLTVTAQVNGAGQVKDEEATAALTYAWSKGDDTIAEANTASYAIPAADVVAAGTLTYKCTISSADTAVDPSSVTVTFTVTVTDPALETIDVALTPADGLTYADGNLAIVGPVPAVFTITTTPDGHKDTVKSTVDAAGTAIVGAVVEGNKLTITPKAPGTTTVTLAGVSAADVTKVITVTVTKAAAPAALTTSDYTVTQPTADVATGSITITQTAPEGTEYVYRLGDSGDWLKFPTDTKTVSGLVPGTYKIRVYVPNPVLQDRTDGVAVTINEYVAPVTVTAVTITTEANSVAVDGTLQLTASITTSDNKTNAATAADVTWSVENGTGSATITDGVLTGVTEGTVTVKVTSKKDDTKFATKTITVTPKTVSRYNVTVTGGTFTVNDVAALTAAAGDTVKATASVPAGKVFDKWTATGITLTADQAASNPLTFTMPANVVALEASFKDQTVTPVDKTALTAAITAAEAVDVTGVKVSEDGADVPTTEKWIAKSVKDAFDAALADAKAVADDADQATVDAAATALTEATTALTEAIENAQKGTKPVDKADLTAAIEAAEAKMEGVLTSTNGKDVDPDKTWVTKTVMDALTKAVADAKAVVEKEDATETELTEAAEALAAASEAFQPAAGTKTSTPIRPSHGGGSVSTPVSDKKTETLPDGTKRETETAKDGTVTVTDTLTDGTKTVTVTTPEGESTTTVTLGRGTESVQVTIPVEDATSGMVAVIVKPDGTEEIIRDSAVVNGEVVFELDKDATVKVVDKSKSFVDVPGHWAESDVNFVAARDLFNGVSSTHFAPDATMTRGMMATVLFRLDGETKADKAVDFSDVTADDWFAEAVDWAAEEGVITGYTDGSFGPDRSITREELVVMIYRYAGASAVEGNDLEKFDDADAVSDWATAAMTWAVQNGIIQGKGNNVLDPKGNASRAEVSAVLQRYVRLSK